MGKNPLDLHRKLRKYHQSVKILRRGLQVNLTNLKSGSPNFALGSYQIKGSSQYSLIINVDLPKKYVTLKVDFWGLNHSNHLQHLNQSKIESSNRDLRLKFWTYPKTKHIFMTFRLEQNEDEKCRYLINYLFLESKIPIPRVLDTPNIPNRLEFDYNIECAPRLALELEIHDLLKDFKSPINFEIFEHEILAYLLQKETGPEYLDILKKNLAICSIKSDGSPSQFRQVQSSELMDLRQEIKKASSKLEEYMARVDNLINHKHSLENMLDQPEDMTLYDKEQYELKIKINKELIEALNFKLNHIKRLKELNESDHRIDQIDSQNMDEILEYYEKRIMNDLIIFNNDLRKTQETYETYQYRVLSPQNNQQHRDQDRLDQILLDYRKIKKKASILKEHLDEKIIKFMSLWYQFLIQQNHSVEY